MKALKITANLQNGFATKFDWCPAIDGILAWSHQRRKLGIDEFINTQHRNDLQSVIDDLPLEKELCDGDWWYKASQPIFNSKDTHVTNIHRRFNSVEAEQYTNEKKKLDVTKGAYKNARIQLKRHITRQVSWQVVGDKEIIDEYLNDITHIGARTAAGFGLVLSWDISEGSEDIARFHRPLPVDFAEKEGISGMVLEWGIRPPYRLTENKRLCVIND